jgi:soluble lytic murein transglycosylase-like protein
MQFGSDHGILRAAVNCVLRGTVALCLIAWTAALISVATAGAQTSITVTQCSDEQQPDQCEDTPTAVHPAQPSRPAPRPAPRPQPKPAPKPQPAQEVHRVSLKTGQDQVKTSDGKTKKETVTVESSPSVNENDAAKKVKAKAPPPPPGAPVTTTGGASMAPLSSPFSFVSSDEALSQFAIPPFLVPIYIAAGRTYGIPWNVLASINQIETDFGRNLNVSSAGALGWMQFMPGTWKGYGVDATGDGVADPYNPVDAIYAAARYLRASGGAHDLHKAIFSYNHAEWYVDRVLKTASVYGSMPSGVVAETGSLAYGRFPLLGAVRYADDFAAKPPPGWGPPGLVIHGKGGAKAVATQPVRVVDIELDRSLATALRKHGALPSLGAAPVVTPGASVANVVRPAASAIAIAAGLAPKLGAGPVSQAALRLLQVATVSTAATQSPAARAHRGDLPLGYDVSPRPGIGVVVADSVGNKYMYRGLGAIRGAVRPGARLAGGDVVGTLPKGKSADLDFATLAQAGTAINPRPLVDGYRLQEAANFYHAVAPLGPNPFVPGQEATAGGAGGAISGSDRALAQKVLNDPNLDIYECGRQDIAQGIIDRRILGALLYLSHNGMKLGISALKCGHSFYTSAGGISAHSFGAAVDIWSFDGQQVLGNQGPGSKIEHAIKLMMQLKGNAAPRQLISLMSLGGPSFAMGDHDDHLHIGYSFDPSLGLGGAGRAAGPVTFPGGSGVGSMLPTKPTKGEEQTLSRELGKITSPHVLQKLGPGAIHVEQEGPTGTPSAADGPLDVSPSAAGARLVDVASAGGGTARAVGVVDGTGHRGWARHQTVILAFEQGVWRVVAPPRDARGRVVNPRLRAISATAGGDGYAVGDHGAVVALTSHGATLLHAPVRGRLTAVAARRSARGLVGVAVGRGGAIVKLAGQRAARAASASGGEPRAVTYDAAGRALIATTDQQSPLLAFRHGRTSRVAAGFHLPGDSKVALSAVAVRHGETWIAGSLSDVAGTGGQLPFVARRAGAAWRTYCAAGPRASGVKELGDAKTPAICDGELAAGSGTGAVRSLALTDRGTVVALPGGIQLSQGKNFRSLETQTPAGQTHPVVKLALTSDGSGWALDEAGQLARVSPQRPAAINPERPAWRQPAKTRGTPAPVAVALGGDRALALTAGGSGLLRSGGWRPGHGPGAAVRDLALAGGSRAWAITDSGLLLHFDDGKWSAPGDWQSQVKALASVVDNLGNEPLTESSQPLSAGLNALALDGDKDGYAVGGHGVILRLADGGWHRESVPTSATLSDVALVPGGAVAVGRHTLLERRDGKWHSVDGAGTLIGDSDVTAVTALHDGTVIAAAGGNLLTRRAGSHTWELASTAPLGDRVQDLTGYRDRAGKVHALALVEGRGGKALLDGDATGWRPVTLPEGLDLTDFALDAETGTLWLAGIRDRAAVTLQQPLSAAPVTADPDAHESGDEQVAPSPIAASGQVNAAGKGIGT